MTRSGEHVRSRPPGITAEATTATPGQRGTHQRGSTARSRRTRCSDHADEHDGKSLSREKEVAQRYHPTPPPGTWVVLDEQWRVLAVGDADSERLYHGTSPRNLGSAARDLFLRPMASAEIRGGAGPHDNITWWSGEHWRTRVIQLIGRASGRVVGRLGCYLPANDNTEFPAPPRAAAVEWELPPPGVGEPRTWWDERMWSQIYELPQPLDFRGSWPLAGLVDDVLDFSDRPLMQQIITTMAHRNTDTLFSWQCWLLRHTRLAQVALRKDPSDSSWARGVVMRIHSNNHSTTLHRSTGTMIDAMVKLSDHPLLAIDASWRQIYLTDEHFARLGLWMPASRSYPDMVHPDDYDTLQTFLEHAADDATATVPTGPITVRFATADPISGDPLPWEQATRMHVVGLGGLGDPNHVLCKLTAAR